MRNRRCKVLRISDEFLIHAVLGWGSGTVPPYRVEGLPDGWDVERVGHDFQYASIEVLISHPSFDEVPQGEMFPHLHGVTVHRVDPESEPEIVVDKITFREFT